MPPHPSTPPRARPPPLLASAQPQAPPASATTSSPVAATQASASSPFLALSPGPRGPLGFRPALNLTVDVSVGQVSTPSLDERRKEMGRQ